MKVEEGMGRGKLIKLNIPSPTQTQSLGGQEGKTRQMLSGTHAGEAELEARKVP